MENVDTSSIGVLHQQHADLENLIRAEYGRPRPDDLMLKRLKLQKLYIKEKIDLLSHH